MQLFDSPFSPFARKVRMVLEHKRLAFESVDGLLRTHHDRLKAVNGRLEVPTLVDNGIVVVNSADIVAYLEHRYPEHPVCPSDPRLRAYARAWERTADTLIDAVLVNVSYWKWAHRHDAMPRGLLQAARADLEIIYGALERELNARDFICGALSIADIALLPHLASARALDVEFSATEHPNLVGWFRRMRSLQICADDLQRARAYIDNLATHDVERTKIFWRGDRIEWLLARGYHEWFLNEIREHRVLWPGLAIPAALDDKDTA